MIADATAPLLMGETELDSTIVRKIDALVEVVAKKSSGPPPWLLPLVLYLVGQLVGSIWWAATMQSDVRYLQQENLKLWQKVETHDLQLGRLDETVRKAVRDAMADSDYVRINKNR